MIQETIQRVGVREHVDQEQLISRKKRARKQVRVHEVQQAAQQRAGCDPGSVACTSSTRQRDRYRPKQGHRVLRKSLRRHVKWFPSIRPIFHPDAEGAANRREKARRKRRRASSHRSPSKATSSLFDEPLLTERIQKKEESRGVLARSSSPFAPLFVPGSLEG